MKTLLQKVILEDNHSFACRYYTTPNFETTWHLHEEVEIIVITKGYGTVMIGDYVSPYNPLDVYFIASNIPHWFRKNNQCKIGEALVLQFNANLFSDFLKQPELKHIDSALHKNVAFRCNGKLALHVAHQLTTIEQAKKTQRLLLLLALLDKLSTSKEISTVTKDFTTSANVNPAIELVINFSFKHYLSNITLEQAANIVGMSIPTFCRYFKKNTKKTYFEFLQELRINHACRLLSTTEKPILTVCYESGFNSWSHFSKQFKAIKAVTPKTYRNHYKAIG